MEKLFKIEISRTPKSIVNAIRFFETEFGENYLEYHDIFSDSIDLMTYAYNKGYLPKDRFEAWKIAYICNGSEVEESFSVIFGSDEDYEPYCITYEDKNSQDDFNTQYEKALLVYGELICSDEEFYTKFVEEYSSGEGNLGYVEVVRLD